MYEIGRVHIWQNMQGDCEYLNGSECIVTSAPFFAQSENNGKWYLYQDTDVIHRIDLITMTAKSKQLRPKSDPAGEKSIMDQFSRPINTNTPEMA
jgi:hypothetical protein